MTISCTLPLSSSQAELAIVGGKRVSLAQLVAASLLTPDGLHFTRAAYRRFVAESNMQPRMVAALNRTIVESIRNAGRRVR
jgi:phosphoenolpyruvate synthase/pyruvate phosphate dikinase